MLESLVATVTKHAGEHLVAVATRLVAALGDVSDPALDARTVFLRVKSGNLLKNNSYAFVHLASESLAHALHKEIEILAPRAVKSKIPSLDELSLVPFEEMDNRVAFDAISRPFEMQYASQIATLNVRLGFLLDRDILRISQNPFRPELFLSVLYQTWRGFDPDTEAHPLILPLLKPSLLFDLAPVYDALCDILMKKGQPGSIDDFNIKKTESAAALKKADEDKKAALAKQLRSFLGGEKPAAPVSEFGDIPMIPMIPDLPAASDGGGGWRPSAAPSFQGVAPAVQSAGPAQHGGQAQPGGGFVPAAPFTGAHASGHAGHAGDQHGGQLSPMGQVPHFGPGGYIGPLPQGGQPGHGAPGGHGMQQGHGMHAGYGDQPVFMGQGGFFPQGQAVIPGPLLDMLKQMQVAAPQAFSEPTTAAELQAGNVFYLPRLKQSLPQGALSRGDESTVDLLSKIFETVFLDPNIPKETRDLIQFLQIPVLKAALHDNNFFYEEQHPARRMIDLMSRMGMEQRKNPDDPVYQAMQRSVDRVGREADAPVSAFTEAVEELEASIKAEEEVAATVIAAPIAAALKQEKVTAATRSAKSAVAARVGSGEVVAMLETFLERKWTSVLTVAYSVEDDKPGAVGNATKTMDDLIWSVKPKITHDERKNLIAKLPGLLATLNKWLDIIKWQDADRLQFFAELAETHASIVRAPLDITPERQLEIAVEVAQQDAMRRLEKENAALAEAAEAANTQLDNALIAVDALERGMWLEFTQNDASVRKVKLAWISPLRTLYIFSTGARQEAFSIPADKLVEAYRADRVKVMRTDGVVGRALSEAMEQAVNDPQHTQTAAA